MIVPLKTITVDLPQNRYPIYIGVELLNNISVFRDAIQSKQVMIVTNTRVAELYLEPLRAALCEYQCDSVILPDGEVYKTLEQWQKIIDALALHKHHRDTTVVALGGGVIGDMAGFAAASYQRGVPFIQVPTTLLAQVDASIGGKTAVNHPLGKNYIGAFYQPKAVIIDIQTLETLPKREFSAGISEIVKAALLGDSEFFNWLRHHLNNFIAMDVPVLQKAISRACEIKAKIVASDEKESGERALLNLGHTFAHGIEHVLGYGTWLHGEAVSVGLVLAAELSYRRQWMSHQNLCHIIQILTDIGLPTRLPSEISADKLLAAMAFDKKIKDQQWHFILLKEIGKAVICNDVTIEELKALLQ